MGVHHIAIASPDIESTHKFYTEAMGFALVKAVVNPTPIGGFAKHLFYDTGDDALIAFWDLHGPFSDWDGAFSTSVGLPDWVNHFAFTAHTREELDAARDRWLSFGLNVYYVDHDFCISIYTHDPSGTLVEWCLTTRPLSEKDAAFANSVVFVDEPEMSEDPKSFDFFEGDVALRPAWAQKAAAAASAAKAQAKKNFRSTTPEAVSSPQESHPG